jgi:hypothetical protein
MFQFVQHDIAIVKWILDISQWLSRAPRGFYRCGISREIFHAHQPNQTGEKNDSGHKQKRYVHVGVTADISKKPKCLHVAERVDDEDVGSKCRRTYSGQRNVGENSVGGTCV